MEGGRPAPPVQCGLGPPWTCGPRPARLQSQGRQAPGPPLAPALPRSLPQQPPAQPPTQLGTPHPRLLGDRCRESPLSWRRKTPPEQSLPGPCREARAPVHALPRPLRALPARSCRGFRLAPSTRSMFGGVTKRAHRPPHLPCSLGPGHRRAPRGRPRLLPQASPVPSAVAGPRLTWPNPTCHRRPAPRPQTQLRLPPWSKAGGARS